MKNWVRNEAEGNNERITIPHQVRDDAEGDVVIDGLGLWVTNVGYAPALLSTPLAL